MTMEADLITALHGVCPRVHPVVAPIDTQRPYMTWQLVGGAAWRYTDNTAPDQRHSLLQLNVWADTMAQALDLVRQSEAVLCASAAFVARPEGEPLADFNADFKRYGAIQDFSIVSSR